MIDYSPTMKPALADSAAEPEINRGLENSGDEENDSNEPANPLASNAKTGVELENTTEISKARSRQVNKSRIA